MASATPSARPGDVSHQQTQASLQCIRDMWSSVFRRESEGDAASHRWANRHTPRTSPERLALASPDNNAPTAPDGSAGTYLYLAYGSNLAAETFLGRRGIRPLSQINVSAPAFDLNFDLPGLPYAEPCFANLGPRRLPKPPPFPGPGDPPFDPPRPPFDPPPPVDLLSPTLPPPRTPLWDKGLIGVVYEVTPEDYATIIRTEGGGAGYQDVLTPCVELPPPLGVPEKPPLPDLPRPFLAHTLYAPRLPPPPHPPHPPDGPADKLKAFWRRLLYPARRPEPDYAQPSPRYLGLMRTGAAEHYLPDDYQAYLGRVEAYVMTTRRQQLGRWLFVLAWAPVLLVLVLLGGLFGGKTGRSPPWLAAATSVLFNLMWMSYDGFFKARLGDGERTMDHDPSRRAAVSEKDLLAEWRG